jgi:HD-GYP domain-containing protein (c-di-GMP phosphodiesterase class II)
MNPEPWNHVRVFLDRIISLHDPHANQHGHHVKDLALELGKLLALSSAELEILSLAAECHDIGKIGITEWILNKPGKFTEAEYVMVQQHTVMGARAIAALEFDPLVAKTILCHHENYDGSGYPSKLSGEAIPLTARIIRIADSFDALTSHRAYRPAFPAETALKRISEAEANYDPFLLPKFIKMLETRQ